MFQSCPVQFWWDVISRITPAFEGKFSKELEFAVGLTGLDV